MTRPVGPEQLEGYQLSPAQQLYLRRGAQVRATRTVRSALTVTTAELAARIQQLVLRHEILRTRYVQVAGLRMPVQVIDPPGQVSVERDRDGSTRLRAGELVVRHRQSAAGTFLVLELPRLSVDDQSWSLLTSLLFGRTPDGGPPAPEGGQALQYADLSAWLGEQLQPGPWPREGPAPIARAGFPIVRPPSAGSQGGGAAAGAASLRVRAPALRRIQAVAAGLGVTEAAIVLAAWQSVYVRYTRHTDDWLVVVTDGRAEAGLGPVLGLLERPVPVRLDVTPAAAFTAVARAAAEALRAAAAVENHVDPETVVPGPGSEAAGPAISFRYRQDPWATAGGPAGLEGFEPPGILHLDCTQGPQTLSVTLAGSDAMVARPDLVELAGAVRHLLAHALADPNRAVGRLRLTAPRRHDRHPHGPENPDPPAGRRRGHPPPVLDAFLAHAERSPGRLAVRCGGAALSYQQLAERAAATGEMLRDRGVGAGDRVAVLAPAEADTVVAMLGTWMSGAAFVPVDPAWPQLRIEEVIRRAAPALALVSGPADTPLQVSAIWPAPASAGTAGPGSAPAAHRPGNAAYVIFTSGTSGAPKGVVIGHEQLAHYARAISAELRLPEGASFAALSTLAADLSYTAIFPTLASGGCVQLVDADLATSPEALAEWFCAHPVNAMKLVPSHMSALLAGVSDPVSLLPADVLVLGGEVLPRALQARLTELAPELRVYNHYGPTETTIGASCVLLDRLPDERCGSVPVGAGLGDNVLAVVDDDGSPLPPWCPGEVLISGPGVGLGYLDELREGKTGFGGRSSGYRSGDLGCLVPGWGIEILGRLDDQVKVRGYRVQLGEIEALLNQQPGVSASAVVARPGEDGLISHLDAYLMAGGQARASTPDIDAVRASVRRQIPAALVPAGWRIVDRLPLTRNGKLDRRALAPIGPRLAQPVRPRDSIEQRLVTLWAAALGTDVVSPDDDFFDLGGHSLRAIKLMSLVNSAFGCCLPMSLVFRARTVAAMATELRSRRTQDSNQVPLRTAQDGAPIFCMHAGGGSTLSYWELARLLPADRPVVGIESWGLHGRPPQQDFADMAQGYAAAIAAKTGKPPALIGWCFGGLMAFETAQALRREGQDVASLTVIDSPAPGLSDDEADQPPGEPGAGLITRFAWHYQLELPPDATVEQLLSAMRRSGKMSPSAGDDQLRTLLDVYRLNMAAVGQHLAGWRPDCAPDYPVLLIRAEPRGLPQEADRTWGWSSVVGPSLSFASISADHHSIMRSPAVADLAAVIEQTIAP